MKKKVLAVIGCIAVILFAGCSEDTSEYESKLPVFSDVVFDVDNIYTGETVTATAVQYEKGKLLANASYLWKIDDSSYSSEVNYSMNSNNPTCSFTAPELPGTYTITFKGQYNISGRAGNSSTMSEINKGTVKYDYTPIKGTVTVTKKFTVKQQPGN